VDEAAAVGVDEAAAVGVDEAAVEVEHTTLHPEPTQPATTQAATILETQAK
jgi:hypothetical protein